MRELILPHGALPLPSYLPDATYGAVRSADMEDLEKVGVRALVMNVFHLMQRPGSSTISALGGLHRMTGWTRPIITDSGGFQAYSLIRQNARFGKLTDQGIRFKPEGGARDFLLTPEKSVQLQLSYGADIVICLDDCTNIADSLAIQEVSVTRTIQWAKRCREEFDRQLRQRKEFAKGGAPPALFAVVQGGGSETLRRRCAEALLEIGFDGYGYGGWPLGADGKLLTEILALTRELIPETYPMHALGIGQPESVIACRKMGYAIFDCALPTRDARQGRLYVWREDPATLDFADSAGWRDTIYIDDDKHIKADRPISPFCDCPTCARYSIGYLRHLHKIGETLFLRLATLHNLRFLTRLLEVSEDARIAAS